MKKMTEDANKQRKDTVTALVGKGVRVEGKKYLSLMSAAVHIEWAEADAGRKRNVNTIRKEISRMVNGERDPWIMYGLYRIDFV